MLFSCILFLFYLNFSYSQCAGSDNNITICDIADPNSKAIDLFGLLGSSAITGGTWVDNLKSGGLNTTTGILNVQSISNSNVYRYTYTVDNGAGCKDSAVITVTVGGYAGVSSPFLSVCSDNTSFNLFQGFSGSSLRPQSNGVWSDDDKTGALTGSMLNASSPNIGTYNFTYTVRAVGTCPAQSSKVSVTIFPSPNAGRGTDLLVCNSDDFSIYKNLDLNSRLEGEDINGVWTESTTSELAGPADSFIDIENIYKLYGKGTYTFSYTVLASNPICDARTSVVNIVIEDQLDFSKTTLDVNTDICESEITTANYKAVINAGLGIIPNGTFQVDYSISSVSSSDIISITSDFTNGLLSFDIDGSYFSKVGNYTVSILEISDVNSRRGCKNVVSSISDVLAVNALPVINNATIVITPVCKGNDVILQLSGDTNLVKGNYSIAYTLSGSNTLVNQSGVLVFDNNIGTLIIPSLSLPNSGDCTINITSITNLASGCTNNANVSKSFTVKPLPSFSSLVIDIPNVCQIQPVTVSISGLGTLTTIEVGYRINNSDTISEGSITLVVNSGKASFIIPASALMNLGTTIFNLTYITDNNTGCKAVVSSSSKTFTISKNPSNPIVQDQSFCKVNKPTINNLLPNGSQFQWFDSASSTVVLSATSLLESKKYYVKEVNTVTGCESSRVSLDVILNDISTPTLNANGENFCGLDNPTVNDLSNNVNHTDELIWFDAAVSGNRLNDASTLKNGSSYYGYAYSNMTGCFSDVLIVTPSLVNCEVTDGFLIPDGFSPNNDGVNDTFRIKDIEFIYPNFTLEIYNRFGNKLFSGDKNKLEWTGSNSNYKAGIDGFAPNGVYFYIINYNKNNKTPKQGQLYLNR
ncbi:gliding motility-associated C-terminal domain-containing protein [Flavobacterium algicola]|uniref:gliding motility-associated C-terminal domain-containing protein n=1 Tax=Flavobacterium algicola TaxID=556529 RepID=UPI001EFEADDB|nr:gliding motility-associated C-terminal domain-containing protein [Flavobacterium algicola]MCG9794055.1 gliding motility-associated C-terminal domain-containing protein [Flavobacterium algicola]